MISGVVSRLARVSGLWLLCVALPACQIAPGPGDTQDSAESQTPQQEAPDQEQSPEGEELVVFPHDVILSCPEPEPVREPVCPPVKINKCPVCPESKLDGKLLLGEIEEVKISPPGIVYTARIDSGAAGTSLHATDIVRFERDGDRWVRFTMDGENGDPITLEREVVRRVRVRQAELEDYERRLVIIMTLTLGSSTEQIEMSLTDRSEMEYPVLIGRNFLRNNAIVDVSQEFIAK